LINIARETEEEEWDSDAIKRFYSGSSNIYDENEDEYLDDDDSSEYYDNDEPSEPICRVVATSDAKIPPLQAYSSLTASSNILVRQLELLNAARSQKKLRDLTYLPCLSDDTQEDEKSQDQKLIATLKQSLEDGGFKLMDQRDFDLCSALNAGYLLRLSLLPDLRDLDPTIGQQFYPELYTESDVKHTKKSDNSVNNKLLFDGRVLVFRRGYSQEVTNGRLLLPKLDYLQASLVQRSSASLTRKLGVIEQKLEDFIAQVFTNIYNTVRIWQLQLLMAIQGFMLDAFKNSGLLENKLVSNAVSNNKFFGADFAHMIEQQNIRTSLVDSQKSNQQDFRIRGNKIFRLGRYGVGERYSTFNVIANSLDLSDALSPFSLCEVGSNDAVSIEQDMYEGLDSGNLKCQYDEMYQSEIPGNQPAAVRLLERVSIQNTVNFFSELGRRDLIKNYFKKSTLKEPSYEEVIVIWRPQKHTRTLKKRLSKLTTLPDWLYSTARIFDMESKLPTRTVEKQIIQADDGPTPIEIRAFNDVPMANIAAVLPKTKLIFRPAGK
jgi:hypothetical protein